MGETFFPLDSEKEVKFIAALIYFKLNHSLYDEKLKFRNLVESLKTSVDTGESLEFYFIECLRFYFQEGEYHIIDNCDDFNYLSDSSKTKSKSIESKVNGLHDKFKLVKFLKSLGINAIPIVVVADTELERFENLNNSKSFAKANTFIESFSDELKTSVEPISSKFGFPSEDSYIREIRQKLVTGYGVNEIGISSSSFNRIVEEMKDRDFHDISDNEARRYCSLVISDNYFQARAIGRRKRDGACAGSFIYVPKKAALERKQFCYEYDILVYS